MSRTVASIEKVREHALLQLRTFLKLPRGQLRFGLRAFKIRLRFRFRDGDYKRKDAE